jgi:Pyruvate/2-oxoacid:ferredoxin oxidoreductase gamma subunit
MAGQMTFDSAVLECLFDPRTLGYGNELIDIVTAYKRNEITELEAKILVFEIRDVRAKEELIANQLALNAVYQAANQALIALVKQEQENVTRT